MSDLTEDDLFPLLELFNNSDLSVLHIRSADFEVFLSRTEDAHGLGGTLPAAEPVAGPGSDVLATTPVVPATAPHGAPADEPATEPVPDPSEEGSPGTEDRVDNSVVVTAPSVGTLYHAPRPDLPAYVSVGSAVEADTTVGLIEAMKVFTAVSAGVSGVVAEILVANNEFVEYGQPLLRISPATASAGR